MALTAYCKKCNREVAPGDICPLCGTKLAKTATHAAWVTERRPVTDWMCWNRVMRWLLPAGLAVLILVLIAEGVSGGVSAVEKLFQGEFPWTLLLIFLILVALVFLALLLQGKELMDYVIDSRGVHVTRYLPQPTVLKLLARLKSPRLMDQIDPEAENPVLRLEEQDLPWRAVARVQLWPEKCYILFYAPVWWLRIPVQATPFSWNDALYYVRDKLGKKKAVDLPEHLRVPSEKKAPARRADKAAPAAMVAPKSAFATVPETALNSGASWPEATEMEEKNDEPPLSEARRDDKERMD
ncbi:MAG: hypothetical protein IJ188_02255 [Clostridia bacterium]|nr:hypothetical protein [Clostridia bacterium]